MMGGMTALTDTERHAVLHAPGTYCDRCGAMLKGDGAWGHDDDCPNRAMQRAGDAAAGLVGQAQRNGGL